MSQVKCKQFDVGLSFSGKDRVVAESLRNALAKLGVKSFYDYDYSQMLVAEHLTETLPVVYGELCDLFVPVISKNYLESDWAKAEKRAALERALHEDRFVLPVRMDDTEIPGVSSALGYASWTKSTPDQIADDIATKVLLKRINRSSHFHDRIRVSDYAANRNLPFATAGVTHRMPLGQAHLASNCVIAYEQLLEAVDAAMIPVRKAHRIVADSGFNGPGYSLQLAFVDSDLKILAHPELPPGKPLNETLEYHCYCHLSRMLNTPDDNRFFYWEDSVRSPVYPSDPSRPRRSNIGFFWPQQLKCHSGRPPLEIFVVGEIHLKIGPIT